ncbi:hypothetical protein GQ600_5828 [Phytophthora cactorum]|nr:hypothetical protein GQ600_5828 [Phytophthora cactorum]
MIRNADYAMIERRLQCISPTCASKEDNMEREEECTGHHRVPIADDVRIPSLEWIHVVYDHAIFGVTFVAQLMLHHSTGFATGQQVSECVKRLRKKSLSRNTGNCQETDERFVVKSEPASWNEQFRLSHTDATFKLSDLGYPAVSCGFTDRSRVYHIAAIVIVSARTHREYEMAFDSVAKVYERLFQTTLRVDVVLAMRKMPKI